MFEKRPYFVIGDLVCNAGAGALVAAAIVAVGAEPGGWPTPVRMAGGMALGGLAAMLLSTGASMLFGALEVTLPMMVTGMATGMLAGMGAAGTTPGRAAAAGALVGVAVVAATYALNARLRARGGTWTF